MKKETFVTSALLIILWQILAVCINNEFLIPAPFQVLTAMFYHLQRPDFFTIVFNTSLRTIFACMISLLMGGSFGIFSGLYPLFHRFFSPVHQLIKTIPNITYMILILIWMGQEKSVSIIVFFILFPVFYAEFFHRTQTIHQDIRELLMIYPVSFKDKWLHVILPMLVPEIFSALQTGIGMGFKVCVMAEILSQVKQGIGRQMNIGRLNLDLASVFAWTIWLLLISSLLQFFVRVVQKLTCEKG